MSVGISKLQVAILARFSREMYRTVRFDSKHFLSGLRVSVRPSNFVYAKNTQNLGETGSPAPEFIWLKHRPVIDGQRNRRKGALYPSRLGATEQRQPERRRWCACVRACGRACVRSCVRACMRVRCVCNYHHHHHH